MLPESLTEEAVARMLYDGAPKCVLYDWGHAKAHARAVLALCEAKVREAVVLTQDDPGHVESVRAASAIVSRIMGEEAPRG